MSWIKTTLLPSIIPGNLKPTGDWVQQAAAKMYNYNLSVNYPYNYMKPPSVTHYTDIK